MQHFLFCLSNSAPLLAAAPPPPPPAAGPGVAPLLPPAAAHVVDVVAPPAAMVPAKRHADHFAHLLPVSNPKRRALSNAGDAHHPIWGRFEVDEKEGYAHDEKKNVEPAPETVDSELARWFAQNPPDNW